MNRDDDVYALLTRGKDPQLLKQLVSPRSPYTIVQAYHEMGFIDSSRALYWTNALNGRISTEVLERRAMNVNPNTKTLDAVAELAWREFMQSELD